MVHFFFLNNCFAKLLHYIPHQQERTGKFFKQKRCKLTVTHLLQSYARNYTIRIENKERFRNRNPKKKPSTEIYPVADTLAESSIQQSI